MVEHSNILLLLCRCTQVHDCLGKLPDFQESYQRNRRLQLNSDLAPPANFLEGYRDFIAQLTGFFIIEDCVQRRCPDLCVGAQVWNSHRHSGWEFHSLCLSGLPQFPDIRIFCISGEAGRDVARIFMRCALT